LCSALTVCLPQGMPAAERHGHRPQGELGGQVAAERPLPSVLNASASVGEKKSPTPQEPSIQKTGSESAISEPGTAAPPSLGGDDVIEVIVSFDDGPHADPPIYGKNYTQKVSQTLKSNIVKKDIKAVFFVQTHAPGRGATPTGSSMIAMLAKEGHVIGIHTGSTADHASHCARAAARRYDANRNGVLDAADGANGLESDMVRARARIQWLAGSQACYVRPTYGERNAAVSAVYRRQRLKMILWDIDSGDNAGSPSVDDINMNIHEGMRRCIAAGKRQVVVLFHDINSTTASNLEEYLGNICIAARKLGKTVVFPSTAERVRQILDARSDQ